MTEEIIPQNAETPDAPSSPKVKAKRPRSKYLYEREADKIKAEADRKAALKVERAKARALKRVKGECERQKKIRSSTRKALKRQRKVSERLALTAEKARVELQRAKIFTEINEPLVDTIAEQIVSGMTLRGACRLAHVSHAKVQKWLIEALAPNPAPIVAYLHARLEEALGQNEQLWVERILDASETKAIDVESGQFVKKGDGKLAVAMLERQHPKDYSPRQIVATEDVRPELDLSDLTDEELEIHRRYETMVEERAKRSNNNQLLLSSPPAPSEAISVEGEEVFEENDPSED